jgi:hypothetical protein
MFLWSERNLRLLGEHDTRGSRCFPSFLAQSPSERPYDVLKTAVRAIVYWKHNSHGLDNRYCGKNTVTISENLVKLRRTLPVSYRYPSALRVPRITEVSSVVHHSHTKPEDINLVGQNIRISKICKLCCAGCVWAVVGDGR